MIDSKIAAALQGPASKRLPRAELSLSGEDLAEFVIAVTLPGTPERFTRTCSSAVVIGRGEDAGLQLSHPLVSRHHVEVSLLEDGRFQVRDLGSRNGTLVNDVPVTGDIVQVEGEARLQVGPYLVVVSPPASLISETLAFDAPRRSRRSVLDKGEHSLTIDGKVVIERLLGLEFGLVEALADQAPNLVANVALGDRLWGNGQWDTYMLHNLVRRVRRKLEEAGLTADEFIVTVPGVGYRLS
jgi:pSer/pThr/pTyr-binding forkhead associated (FHA) protein